MNLLHPHGHMVRKTQLCAQGKKKIMWSTSTLLLNKDKKGHIIVLKECSYSRDDLFVVECFDSGSNYCYHQDFFASA